MYILSNSHTKVIRYIFDQKFEKIVILESKDHDPLEAIGGRQEVRKRANQIRNRTYGKYITASSNYFIALIQYCRNSCLYCGFSRKQLRDEIPEVELPNMIVSPDELDRQLDLAKKSGCEEVLFVLGDRPEQISSKTRDFLEELGFENSVEYTHWACSKTIEVGLSPHVNIGVIDNNEWEFLQPVIASAGLMLENSSSRLIQKGMAHQSSPDKIPEVRIECIKNALELEIPFTSGILINIGETDEERLDTIQKLADLAEEFDTLSEVIIQAFHPLGNSPWRDRQSTQPYLILDTIAACRTMIEPNVHIQFPPNLGDLPIIEGIKAGADDLGGVSSVTVDYVNFDSLWPQWQIIQDQLASNSLELVERGPVHTDYVKYAPNWYQRRSAKFVNRN